MDKISSIKRIAWIDNVRVFAILMVILGHSLISPNATPIVRWIIAFNMPLFVIISGYCAYHTLSVPATWKEFPAYLEKTTKHILFPALMGTMAVSLVNQVEKGLWLRLVLYFIANILAITIFIKKDDNKIAAYAFKAMLVFSVFVSFLKSPYWFLTMTWTVLVVYRILTMLLKDKILLISFPAFGVALTYSYFANNSHFISEFFLYFIVGLMMRKYSDVKVNYYVVLTLCLLIGIETYTFCENKINFYKISMTDLLFSTNWYYWILRQIGAICWSSVLIMIFRSASSRYSAFSSLGGGTLGIYILQGFFVPAMEYTEKAIGLTDTNWLAVSIPVFMVNAWLSIFIVRLLDKYRVTRELYLGKTK